jgi:carbamoyltransferase
LTDIPSLINTSFNMHGEPIVCTPQDALRSFLQGDLEYLALGNWLVSSSNVEALRARRIDSEWAEQG